MTVRLAEEIESVFIDRENDLLDENTADRAELISTILCGIGNETQIDATHRTMVRAYVLATFDKLPKLDQHAFKSVQRAFAAIHDLMSGCLCSESRFEEINRHYRPHEYDDMKEYNEKRKAKDARAVSETGAATPETDEIVTLREKLAKLERLPENEAISFHLESEIYRLEHEAADKWQDVIR